MNWVLILLVLVLAWNIAWGYHTGFLRVLYSLGKWVLILVILIWMTPIVADILTHDTKLPQTIEKRVEAHIKEKGEAALKGDTDETSTESVNSDESTDPDEEVNSLVALGIMLPKVVVDQIPDLGELASQSLEESGIYEKLAKQITGMAIYGIAGIMVLIVAFIACHVIATIFKVIEKLPGIRQVNHGLGIAAGGIKGMVIIWLLLALLALEVGSTFGRFMIPYIYESSVLEWLYENNFILNIIMAFF